MNEELIGEEITLVTRAGEELLQLLLSAARAFLEAAEAGSTDLSGTEGRLRTAMGEIDAGDDGSLVARLVVVRAGLEIHLAPTAAPGAGVTVTCPA